MKRSEIIRRALDAAQAEGLTIEPDDDTGLLESLLTGGAPSADVTALREQVATLQAQQRQTAATAFADAQIAARRALPAERDGLIALHIQAAQDDTQDSGSRLASLTNLISSRPAHALAGEHVSHGSLIALVTDATAETAEARKRRLLSMTAVGRTALAGGK